MARKFYVSPMILDANGTITMTVSQLGELGIDNVEDWTKYWNDFWDASGDIVDEIYPDFDINDSSTYPKGFDPADENTWFVLIDEP